MPIPLERCPVGVAFVPFQMAISSLHQCGGVILGACASQSEDRGSLFLSSRTKDFRNGIHRSAWRSAKEVLRRKKI